MRLLSADKPYPFYVGVDTQGNPITKLAKNLLMYYYGKADNSTSEDCTDAKHVPVSKIHVYWTVNTVFLFSFPETKPFYMGLLLPVSFLYRFCSFCDRKIQELKWPI